MRRPHTSPHTRPLAVRVVMCQLGCISIRLGEPQYLPELVMAGLHATNHSTDIDKCGLTVSLLSLPVSALTCGDHGWPPAPAWPGGQGGNKFEI